MGWCASDWAAPHHRLSHRRARQQRRVQPSREEWGSCRVASPRHRPEQPSSVRHSSARTSRRLRAQARPVVRTDDGRPRVPASAPSLMVAGQGPAPAQPGQRPRPGGGTAVRAGRRHGPHARRLGAGPRCGPSQPPHRPARRPPGTPPAGDRAARWRGGSRTRPGTRPRPTGTGRYRGRPAAAGWPQSGSAPTDRPGPRAHPGARPRRTGRPDRAESRRSSPKRSNPSPGPAVHRPRPARGPSRPCWACRPRSCSRPYGGKQPTDTASA